MLTYFQFFLKPFTMQATDVKGFIKHDNKIKNKLYYQTNHSFWH